MNVACSSATFAHPGRGRRGARAVTRAARWWSTPRSPRATPTSSCATSTSSSATRAPRSCSSAPTAAAATAPFESPRHQARDAVLEQHPQRLRLPQPLRGRARATRTSCSSARTGSKVFREVCPMVADLIARHLDELGFAPRERAAVLAAPGEPQDEPADRQGACSAGRAEPRRSADRSSTSTRTRARPVRSSPSTSTAPTSRRATSA